MILFSARDITASGRNGTFKAERVRGGAAEQLQRQSRILFCSAANLTFNAKRIAVYFRAVHPPILI
jgi:hypothetical protein